jgi:flagellar basal body-associated protein FliL
MNDPSDERRKSMALSRKAWIAIGVLMVVAAIVAIGLVASGGGGAGGAY